MILEREGKAPNENPTVAAIERTLKTLRSSYASMTAADGSYVQVAGGPWLYALEMREADAGMVRAFLDAPVVPDDGPVTLSSTAGSIRLAPDEWIPRPVVVEVWCASLAGRELPETVRWRDLGIEAGSR